MTLDEATGLVKTLRRHVLMGRMAKALLAGFVLLGMVGALLPAADESREESLWMAAMFAALVWIWLARFSAKQMRATQQASTYVSTGRLDLAEEHLKSAMQIFSLYRAGKLLVCHNLAVVAHGQKNYSAAAVLCDGILSLGLGVKRGVERMCRMLLADCRLSLGETVAAIRAIAPLRMDDPALSLQEQLMLLPIELRCQVASSDFEAAVDSLPRKVKLAELLESPKAALVHALLARACAATGREAIGEFLGQRAALYHDLKALGQEYPVLRDQVGPAKA